MKKSQKRRRRIRGGRGNHFWGEALAKATPFSMLPLRPSMALARSCFSFSVMLPKGLMAFSAPLG